MSAVTERLSSALANRYRIERLKDEKRVAGKTEESDRRFNELEAYLNNLPANHVVLLKSVAVRNATEIKP